MSIWKGPLLVLRMTALALPRLVVPPLDMAGLSACIALVKPTVVQS